MKVIALSILNLLDETQKIQNFSLFEFKKNINKIIDKKFIDYLGFQEELNSVINKYISKTKKKTFTANLQIFYWCTHNQGNSEQVNNQKCY